MRIEDCYLGQVITCVHPYNKLIVEGMEYVVRGVIGKYVQVAYIDSTGKKFVGGFSCERFETAEGDIQLHGDG